MSHKNDYSVIAFFPEEKPKKWEFVHKLNSIATLLNEKYPTWVYLNVYERRTKKYLKRFYKNSPIPDFI